jgi:hypothetical protein
MPCPWAAETACTSPSPSSKNSAIRAPSVIPSALLATSTQALPNRRRYLRDVVVLRRQSPARIHDEQHHIRLGHRLPGLLAHLLDDTGLGFRLEAAGVDHDVFVFAMLALAVVAVPGQAGISRRRSHRADRLVSRLNSVDFPTLGRPTRARTGFIDQPFHLVGTPTVRNLCLPPYFPVGRIHANQPPAQASNQGIPDCHHNSGAPKYKGFTGTLLLPELATVNHIERSNRSITGQYKDPCSSNERGGHGHRTQFLSP